jgi:hypothetical protein
MSNLTLRWPRHCHLCANRTAVFGSPFYFVAINRIAIPASDRRTCVSAGGRVAISVLQTSLESVINRRNSLDGSEIKLTSDQQR